MIYMCMIYMYLTTKKLGTINQKEREREIKGDVWEGLEEGKAMWKNVIILCFNFKKEKNFLKILKKVMESGILFECLYP